MHIEFDANKNDTNIHTRGLSFERAANFDFETAVFKQDTRRDYGEIRLRALGYLDGRIHSLVFTETAKGIRIISFRKANKREVLTYAQETKS
ncbi:MAG: BrnT family toxin [Ferrovum myxofaciens]|uniref:BrnT family toxin n=1 Tax=Ferrovum myxofaciens TaxID=416213 RepID=UPI0023573868|nr:BrnT family toxin [Ferrovum myxofaciens]QKE40926.1 MAG: BrnT family toxin [Ferrovum myxofaciens]